MSGISQEGTNYPATYEDYVPPGAVARALIDIFNLVYPVGSYYETTDTNFDPNVQFGGTWVLMDQEYELVAWARMTTSTTISAQKNIQSITGTNDRIVTFSTPLLNADFLVAASCEYSGTGQEIIGVYNQSTTGFRIDFCNHAGTAVNPSMLSIMVFGLPGTRTKYKWHRTA